MSGIKENISTNIKTELPAFHIMAKPIGPVCNLDCTYCFYLEKELLYASDSNFTMPLEILESFIRQTIQAHHAPVVNFAWQGGEPTLLGLDFFKRAVKYQNKYANGKRIENSFQTNGILINDEWCDFFKEHNFLVGLSIDGPEHLHNHYRLTRTGGKTFTRVMKGVDCLKKNDVRYNTLTTVNRMNSYHPQDVYHFLKEVTEGFIQFVPIVERKTSLKSTDHFQLITPNHQVDAEITDWSVEANQYGTFLSDIFDEWVRRDVGQYFIQIFDVALENWLDMEPGLCYFKKKCGRAMALEHNGDLYSCDHYVYPEHLIGNIMDTPLTFLIDSDKQKHFGSDKQDKLPTYCVECDVLFACNGECPKHRFLESPEGENRLNYLCSGYKKFFHHIDIYMKFMANEIRHKRAPANVMQWTMEKDRGFAGYKIGRNEPCPCGSGKKYKKCCQRT